MSSYLVVGVTPLGCVPLKACAARAEAEEIALQVSLSDIDTEMFRALGVRNGGQFVFSSAVMEIIDGVPQAIAVKKRFQ